MADTDESVIRKLIAAHHQAIRRRDAAGVLEPLAEYATTFDLKPPLEHRTDPKRDREELEQWFASWEGPIEIETPDPVVAVDGDLAFAFGLSRMHGMKRGVGPTELSYRLTLCFERIGGEWKVVHEHTSVPFLMDGSGKAALDLSPE